MGVTLATRFVKVEDVEWLWKKDDNNYINVAEPDTILKSMNLVALRWVLLRFRFIPPYFWGG